MILFKFTQITRFWSVGISTKKQLTHKRFLQCLAYDPENDDAGQAVVT